MEVGPILFRDVEILVGSNGRSSQPFFLEVSCKLTRVRIFYFLFSAVFDLGNFVILLNRVTIMGIGIFLVKGIGFTSQFGMGLCAAQHI